MKRSDVARNVSTFNKSTNQQPNPMVNPVIEESWKRELADQFASPYFEELKRFLVAEKQQFPVYPPGPQIFNAFNLTRPMPT